MTTNRPLVIGSNGRVSQLQATDTVAAGWIHLEGRTANSASELVFNAYYSSVYKAYRVRIRNLTISLTAFPYIQFSTDGGQNFDTANNYSNSARSIKAGTSTAGTNANLAVDSLRPTGSNAATILGNATTPANFTLLFQDPTNGTAKHVQVVGGMFIAAVDSTPYIMTGGSCSYNVASAPNAFRFKTSAGTFSCTIDVWGLIE